MCISRAEPTHVCLTFADSHHGGPCQSVRPALHFASLSRFTDVGVALLGVRRKDRITEESGELVYKHIVILDLEGAPAFMTVFVES